MRDDKIIQLLTDAYEVARNSPDNSSQNGAILTNLVGDILCVDCNRFPNGTEPTKENLEKPLKYSLIEHAERNVIYKAARLGIPTDGKILVCPWFACADCARAIVCAGISLVIGHKPRMNNTPESWKNSVKIGEGILSRGNVSVFYWDEPLGLDPILANGELWRP